MDITAFETSSESDRKTLSITVYNGGMGLIRETRSTQLPEGRITLRFEDVPSSILPQTVRVKPADKSPGFTVFEQNYEYDLISNQRLLEKYVGRELTLITTNPKTGEETSQKAKLVAYNNGPVFQIGKDISLGHPGRIVVPSIPDNLYAKPTLIWELMNSKKGNTTFEVSYQTAGMDWSADYIINLNEKETSSDIQSWVTLSNSSGVSFENATLQLVAGKVQLISNRPSQPLYKAAPRSASMSVAESTPAFQEENLSDYYLYTLDKPTNIRNQQTKQVQLFSTDNVKIEKRFIFDNMPVTSGSQKQFTNARVRYDIHNTDKNRLGRPIPAGTVRVFKADSQGRVQLLGEDSIDHTPKEEWLRVATGSAFDVVGDMKQTEYEIFKVTSGYKASYEISVRNRKKEDITVRVYANVYGDWKITKKSHDFEKESQQKIYFDIKLPAGKEELVKYTLEVKQ